MFWSVLQLDAVSEGQLFGRSAFVQYGEGTFRYIFVKSCMVIVVHTKLWVVKGNGSEHVEMDHNSWGCELCKVTQKNGNFCKAQQKWKKSNKILWRQHAVDRSTDSWLLNGEVVCTSRSLFRSATYCTWLPLRISNVPVFFCVTLYLDCGRGCVCVFIHLRFLYDFAR
jgi:hypothetical protein